jgi:hypothetical protein
MGQEERDDGVFVVVWKEGKGEWALSRGLSCYWFSCKSDNLGVDTPAEDPARAKSDQSQSRPPCLLSD